VGAGGRDRRPAVRRAAQTAAILADVGVALLLYRLAGRWRGPRAGLLAAGLYLFIPVTWYDSALWGQVDAVPALVMVAALVLLVEGWSERAAALAMLAVLVKPQALVCVVVVAPVLVRRHLLAVGSGPVPVRWVGHQGPVRLLTSALAAVLAGTLVMAPFDIARFAPSSVATVPILGSFAGLAGLIQSAGDQFSVLTANAYNLWALVGPQPLVASVGSWTADSLLVIGGLPAVTVCTVLLVAVALLVAAGLLRRDGVVPILVGFTVIAFAFYALPTRVHERYLFPVFTSGAVLASVTVAAAAGYLPSRRLRAWTGRPRIRSGKRGDQHPPAARRARAQPGGGDRRGPGTDRRHGRARGGLAAGDEWGRGAPQLPCPREGSVYLGRRGHPHGARAEQGGHGRKRSDRGPRDPVTQPHGRAPSSHSGPAPTARLSFLAPSDGTNGCVPAPESALT
jgi:hypothetical protein